MGGIPAVSAIRFALDRVQFEAEFQARALAKQQEVIRDVGDAALKLIESARLVVPETGHNLDVRV